jgi:hypothetical protein
MEVFIGVIVFFAIVLFWLIPIIMLVKSERTSGGTKVLWLLAMLFISWFAWLAYILLVPKAQPIKRFANS